MFSGGLAAAIVGAVTRMFPSNKCVLHFLIMPTGGRKNVIPGTIMGTLTGYLGQKAYILLDERHTSAITTEVSKDPLWKRALNSKFSPMKVLSDDQYADLLKEKLLRVDTDIAIIDDDIEKWRKQQRLEAHNKQTEESALRERK